MTPTRILRYITPPIFLVLKKNCFQKGYGLSRTYESNAKPLSCVLIKKKLFNLSPIQLGGSTRRSYAISQLVTLSDIIHCVIVIIFVGKN